MNAKMKFNEIHLKFSFNSDIKWHSFHFLKKLFNVQLDCNSLPANGGLHLNVITIQLDWRERLVKATKMARTVDRTRSSASILRAHWPVRWIISVDLHSAGCVVV